MVHMALHTFKKTLKTYYLQLILIPLIIISALLSESANAGSREQAKRLHDRIAGVPPTEMVLDNMQAVIDANVNNQGLVEAAYLAMQHKAFYSVTLKNIAAPWTNRDFDVFVPLNDYIATYIGLVRDGADLNQTNTSDFREILHGDVLYIGTNTPLYTNNSNAHYEALENSNVDLGSVANLMRTTQSAVTGLNSSATAGVMTSRAGSRAFFVDGTNRAMFRYTVLNHMCYDLEQLKDNTRPADRIRQDISRTPGGDSRLFLNNCAGCHTGMDPMAQAFAYYQWEYDANANNAVDVEDGQLIYTDGVVQPKYFINSTTFPHGFITPDDNWDNYWREGVNRNLLGWDTNSQGLTGSGNGAKSLGVELANSEAFARCHVGHVFKAMCLREPGSSIDSDEIDRVVNIFKVNNYNLKRVYAETASYCAGS